MESVTINARERNSQGKDQKIKTVKVTQDKVTAVFPIQLCTQ